jgi:hypothetical protein
MKLLNWGKIALWLALIAFFSWLLSQRYSSIMEGASNATDIVIFLIWIALIAAFVFQEVDFFGVRLKREIDNLRTEFKEQIISLKSEIINMQNQNVYVYPLMPSTDSELKDLEKRVTPIIEKTLKGQGLEKQVPSLKEPKVPDDTQFLFSVRYAIENELRRLSTLIWSSYLEKRPQSILAIASTLSEMGKITPQVARLIREVYAICSSAVHGGDVSETSLTFVREMSPPLLAYLKSIEGLRWFGKEQT